jgi:hypothetical protein
MALAEIQAALARLSTDPAARALFIGDAHAFAEQTGLSPEDLATLREMAESSLQIFAHSLLHKRAHEAARAIPLTHAALGEDFGRTFEAFAATHQVARDPALDALHFIQWLPGHLKAARAACDAARYEAAWLLMRRTDRRLHAGVFRPPGARSRILALWWRPHRSAPFRYFQWPGGNGYAAPAP